MPTHADLLVAIDAFMNAPKRILGTDVAPTWGPGFTSHEREMKYPIEVDGEASGAKLMIVSFPMASALKFRLGLTLPAMACRLDYTDETHPNSLEGIKAGLPPVVTGPHYHSWTLNRRFFRGSLTPPKLHDAVPFLIQAHTFDAILRWFCSDVQIDGLPPDHRIALPRRDRLI